jgi:hypothetical protein
VHLNSKLVLFIFLIQYLFVNNTASVAFQEKKIVRVLSKSSESTRVFWPNLIGKQSFEQKKKTLVH